MGKLHIIDMAIVAAYLVICLGIGLYKSTQIKNIKEYAVGNKNFSTFIITSTIFATFMGVGNTVGHIEKIYNSGLIYGLSLFFIPLNWLLIKHIYVKNIYLFDGCISMSEIMKKLYGRIGHHITNVSLVLISIGLVALCVTAIGYLFNYFLDLDYVTGIAVGVGILTIYSVSGGVRAVALTDGFQFLIFFFALPIACGIAYSKAGSYTSITNKLPQSNLDLFYDSTSFLEFLGYAFWMILPAISAPYVQRLLMAKNTNQLKQSFDILTLFSLFFSFVIFVLGFSIRAIFPDIEAKLALYTFLGSLSPVFVGIMVSGMLAVVMSTADSWLNSLSVIVSHDVIKSLFPKINEKQELLIARIATLVCAGLAVFIALYSREIFKLLIFLEAFACATIFIPFTVGFFKFRTNHISFLGSVIFGILFTFVAKNHTGEFGILSLVSGFVGNFIGLFGTHYIQVEMGVIKVKKKLDKISKATLIDKIEDFTSIKKKVEISESLYYIFALFVIALNIPILILGYNAIGEFVSDVSKFLRYIVLFLVLVLLCGKLYKPNKKLNNLWYAAMLLNFPLMGTYLFITSNYDILWGINCFISIITLFLFINIYDALLLSVMGVFAAIILNIGSVLLYNVALHNHVSTNIFGGYSIMLICITIAYVIYNKTKEEKVKQKAAEVLGCSIAHDVNLPLNINLTSIDLMKESLLKKDYKNVKKHILKLEQCNKQAIQDIDIMLSSIIGKNLKKIKDWGEYSILKCVNEALDNYSMSDEQNERISFLDRKNKKKDFSFVGSKILFQHVIFNLLKNAFKYAGNHAHIKIFVKDKQLYIKDNGYGMDEEVFKNIFKDYVSISGRGIGLNYCQQAMFRMRGDITCRSIKGKGTEFILYFR